MQDSSWLLGILWFPQYYPIGGFQFYSAIETSGVSAFRQMLGSVQAQSICMDATVETPSSVLAPIYIWSELWKDGSCCQDLHRDVTEKEVRKKPARVTTTIPLVF